jgi:hypothetical protein
MPLVDESATLNIASGPFRVHPGARPSGLGHQEIPIRRGHSSGSKSGRQDQISTISIVFIGIRPDYTITHALIVLFDLELQLERDVLRPGLPIGNGSRR